MVADLYCKNCFRRKNSMKWLTEWWPTFLPRNSMAFLPPSYTLTVKWSYFEKTALLPITQKLKTLMLKVMHDEHLPSFSENIFNFCTMLRSSSSALSRHCKRNLKIRFRLRNYKYWMEHLRTENKSSKSQQRKCSVRYGNCVIIM